MSEDKGKSVTETIADEAKGVAVEVYKDGAKPTVGAVGGVLGRIVKLALRPLELLIHGGERLMSRVERKLGGVPEDRLLPPPATIAAPAALHYALLGEGEEVLELREMFENLLVTSMDRATAASAHPAFVGMISQMTPDEAWILKSITQSEHAAVNLTDFSGSEANGVPRGLRTMLGHGIGIDESRIPQYISNLDRLGILRIDWSRGTTADHDSYKRIEQLVNAEHPHVKDPNRELLLSAAVIYVTALGAQFLQTCVATRPSVVPVTPYG